MASLIENSPIHGSNLKSKVNHVKYLLEDANKRLQDEVSKHGIFTTKTSASSMAASKQNGNGQKHGTDVKNDLKRTIDDIGTIQSVLSCPIFNRIVNVTDSLDKLSYHLNLRPSIGPSDINIDDNGELILAPPIDYTSLSNYENGQLDSSHLADNSNSPQFEQRDYLPDNDPDSKFMGGYESYEEVDPNASNGVDSAQPKHLEPDECNLVKETLNSKPMQHANNGRQQYDAAAPNFDVMKSNSQAKESQPQKQNRTTTILNQSLPAYDTEKLVSSCTTSQTQRNTSSNERSRVKSVAAAFENAMNESSEGRRLYKANGNYAINRMVSDADVVSRKNGSMTNGSTGGQYVNEQQRAPPSLQQQPLGYSNELYHGAQDFKASQNSNTNQQRLPINSDFDPQCAYANANIRKQHQFQQANADQLRSKPQPSNQVQKNERTTRASPSNSDGSTVRLADDCDSGTSSFRSQAAKGNVYSPQSHKPIEHLEEDPTDSSLDQEQPTENQSPEMERIKVTLEKGPEGMGITIAGYTCDQEEISGIFIKCITPGGPADRCGKIKILDQIVAVNGQEILGYSNPEATSILRRQTGNFVTLELMRYLTESRYQKIQNLLENASPAANLKLSTISENKQPELSRETQMRKPQEARRNSDVLTNTYSHDPNVVLLLNNHSGGQVKAAQHQQSSESMYNNSSVFRTHEPARANHEPNLSAHHSEHNHIPVAAQRYSGTTTRVIETKQGPRNTIEVRSPMFQATATYINRVVDADTLDSANLSTNTSVVDRLRRGEEFTVGGGLRWEKAVEIIELQRDSSAQGLGFTVKEYEDNGQSIIMITSITPGGVADADGKLKPGDLLVFVDDKNLERASLNEAVKALKETNGQVRLGVLKLKL